MRWMTVMLGAALALQAADFPMALKQLDQALAAEPGRGLLVHVQRRSAQSLQIEIAGRGLSFSGVTVTGEGRGLSAEAVTYEQGFAVQGFSATTAVDARCSRLVFVLRGPGGTYRLQVPVPRVVGAGESGQICIPTTKFEKSPES